MLSSVLIDDDVMPQRAYKIKSIIIVPSIDIVYNMDMLPTLRQLSYLVALADTGSFSKAAAHVYVTQPTLSAGVAELEAILGQPLVDRGARGGLTLTPAGADALVRARALLMGAEDLVRAARITARPLSGPLRLGAIPTIAPYYLADVLARVQPGHPDLRLILREDQSARLVEALSTGALDAAILALPYPAPGMTVVSLFDDPLWLVCRPDHALAHKTEITDADLATAPLLFMEDGHCLREHALAACPAVQARDNGVAAASLYTLAHLVAAGHGVALIPDMAVRAGLVSPLGLVTVPFASPQPMRQIALMWRTGGPAAGDAAALAAVLKG